MAPERLIIISTMLEKPIAAIDYDKIYSIRFFGAREKGEGLCQYLKITFYDKDKFMNGMLQKVDPFQKSEKWIRLKLKEVDQKVVEEFNAKINQIKAEGFFLNWI